MPKPPWTPDWEFEYEYRIPAYPNDPQSYPKKVVDRVRKDLDSDYIEVELREGDPIQVVLYEQIWSAWSVRFDLRVSEGESLKKEVRINSGWADGDHRLLIWTFNPNRAVRCWVYQATLEW